MKRRLSDADVVALHARYQTGLSFREVTQESGVPTPTLQRRFHQLDLPVRPRVQPIDGISDRTDGYSIVPLAGRLAAGRCARIDTADRGVVEAHRWHLTQRRRPSGGIDGPYAKAYMLRNGRESSILMHVLITGWARTDHIDHDGLNNQRSNLRPATTAQNNHNQRAQINSHSRYKGVTWHKGTGKWQAAIKVAGRCRYLGIFPSEEDAARAYNLAALAAYGEYAFLNEIGGELA